MPKSQENEMQIQNRMYLASSTRRFRFTLQAGSALRVTEAAQAAREVKVARYFEPAAWDEHVGLRIQVIVYFLTSEGNALECVVKPREEV